jgi:hypothetical protein
MMPSFSTTPRTMKMAKRVKAELHDGKELVKLDVARWPGTVGGVSEGGRVDRIGVYGCAAIIWITAGYISER